MKSIQKAIFAATGFALLAATIGTITAENAQARYCKPTFENPRCNYVPQGTCASPDLIYMVPGQGAPSYCRPYCSCEPF